MAGERVVSVVVVFDGKHNVLSLRRGPTDPWMPGAWNFPGGYNEPSDPSPRAAAARELKEETGISVRPKELQHAFETELEGRKTHVYWLQLAKRPKVRLHDGENTEFRWTPLQEVPKPAIPSVRLIQRHMDVAQPNVSSETWAFMGAALLPVVLMPVFMNEYRKDLSPMSRLARGVALGLGWSAYGTATLAASYLADIPVLNVLTASGPILAALQFGGLPVLGYTTYLAVKKPKPQLTGPL